MRNNHQLNSAWAQVEELLAEGETVESITFGTWGSAHISDSPENWCEFPDDILIPPAGVPMTLEQSMPYFDGWAFSGEFGRNPSCFSAYIHTETQVIFVKEYDGSTRLVSVPRDPAPDVVPVMV